VESIWVHSARRPLNGLLYLPRVIVMMENLVVWRLTGETEVLGETLPQGHFVHHKSHVPYLSSNPGRRGGKPATNRLSYGAVLLSALLISLNFPFIWVLNFFLSYTVIFCFTNPDDFSPLQLLRISKGLLWCLGALRYNTAAVLVTWHDVCALCSEGALCKRRIWVYDRWGTTQSFIRNVKVTMLS
jgi:hypothetical protein